VAKHETGQPGIDYLRAALESGAHAITANKGVLVHGFQSLNELARDQNKRFLFEAAVLDSAPVFSLFREALPAVKLRGFSGAFSSTTNVIIETMEAGRSFDEGVKTAQELGVTETDPSHDIDGWDSTVKVCALASVLMNVPLKPEQVAREGIRNLSQSRVQTARGDGKPFKLISRAKLNGDGTVSATVRPEQVAATDPLGNVRGTSLAIHFELDMMPGLTITSHRPNLQSTAYGLLADFVNSVKDYKT
jgi:homoserine dehydrogenase